MTTTPEGPQTNQKPRYAQPRKLLNWNKNDHLRILKMLAWVVYKVEHVRGAAAMEARVNSLCQPVTQLILGGDGVTLSAVTAHTLAEQGGAITGARLLQRADKAERYDELNAFAGDVLAAYELLRE